MSIGVAVAIEASQAAVSIVSAGASLSAIANIDAASMRAISRAAHVEPAVTISATATHFSVTERQVVVAAMVEIGTSRQVLHQPTGLN